MQPDTTLPKDPKVQIYEALLTQNGTNAPTTKILLNTLGEIIWTRDSAGIYFGTTLGLLPTGKTTLLISNNLGSNTIYLMGENSFPDSVYVETKQIGGSDVDDELFDTYIQIKVYNQ